jgi:hypothetical protein
VRGFHRSYCFRFRSQACCSKVRCRGRRTPTTGCRYYLDHSTP